MFPLPYKYVSGLVYFIPFLNLIEAVRLVYFIPILNLIEAVSLVYFIPILNLIEAVSGRGKIREQGE
ncbi:hypothetical protein MAR_035402 [Mya arenaria]|uniref:Uncharacterized protein n=1 Tax=Mya arenaria TaxID=6604 RepID=A0ABY7ENM0_MYAAR|nr:hypothetical protein MAR_035402 [Mya arenaria]